MKEYLTKIIEKEPKYRREQIERAWFDVKLNSFEEITTLPKDLRERLKNLPWFTVALKKCKRAKPGRPKKRWWSSPTGS